MATASDLIRLLASLGLLATTTLIVRHMIPRLHNRDSYWLAAFVFTITFSAFIATTTKIGSDEPLLWYGAPLRLVAVTFGLVYIWKTRDDEEDDVDDGVPDSQQQEDHEDSWFDKILKKIMPNGTVMRRFIAAAYIIGVISGVAVLGIVNRVDEEATRGAKAICAIIVYGEDTLEESQAVAASTEATKRFGKLVGDMRATEVRCTPPPPKAK